MNSFTEWVAAQNELAEVTDAEAASMFEWTCRFGSGNGWTGAAGEGARFIRQLLLERHRLLCELYEMKQRTAFGGEA